MHLNSKLSEIDQKIKSVDADIKKAEERLAKHKRGFLLRISLCVVAVIVALTMFGIYKMLNPTIDGITYKLINEEGKIKPFFGDQYVVDDIDNKVTNANILPEVKGKPVTHIDFTMHASLQHITIPDSILHTGDMGLLFRGQEKNTPKEYYTVLEFNEYDNGYYLGNEKNPYKFLVSYKNKNVSTCKVHKATEFIYAGAFEYNENLEEVVFEGENIIDIGNDAFFGCEKLKEINLPKGLKRIGTSAFYGTAIEYFEIPDTVEEIASFAFNRLSGCKCLTIPASVKKMGVYITQGSSVTIYCEAESKPEGWDKEWAQKDRYQEAKVVWGHKCEADEWKTDKDGNSVLRCKDCNTILDEKHGN